MMYWMVVESQSNLSCQFNKPANEAVNTALIAVLTASDRLVNILNGFSYFHETKRITTTKYKKLYTHYHTRLLKQLSVVLQVLEAITSFHYLYYNA